MKKLMIVLSSVSLVLLTAVPSFAQDSSNVRLLGFCDTQCAYGVAVAGQYAYVADAGDSSGLRVINITNPAAPSEVGFCGTPGGALGVAVSGNYAYVEASGLRVINITNPSSPTEVGFYVTPGEPIGVAVSGNYAYVADWDYGLRVVNITNPAAPYEVGFYDTPGSAWGVTVQGNYAYVADGLMGGLRVVNISNPTALFEVGFYDTPGQAWDVAVSGNLAYVADFNYFGIYDCSAATTVPEAGHVVIPARFALHAPFPNPFNPATNIVFDLPEPGSVTVKVFDLMGREVAVLVNGEKPAGQHTISFDARDLPSGVYVCRMTANEFTASHKMMLIR